MLFVYLALDPYASSLLNFWDSKVVFTPRHNSAAESLCPGGKHFKIHRVFRTNPVSTAQNMNLCRIWTTQPKFNSYSVPFTAFGKKDLVDLETFMTWKERHCRHGSAADLLDYIFFIFNTDATSPHNSLKTVNNKLCIFFTLSTCTWRTRWTTYYFRETVILTPSNPLGIFPTLLYLQSNIKMMCLFI